MIKKALLSLSLLLLFSVLLRGEAFSAEIEKELFNELRVQRKAASTALAKLTSSTPDGLEIAHPKRSGETIRANHLLMLERFKDQGEKVSSLGPKARERQDAVATAYVKAMDELLALMDAVPSDDTTQQETFEKLKTFIDRIAPTKKLPLLGTLPYKHLGYPAREPAVTPAIVPAYRGGNRTIVPADTAGTAESPVSAEITALAQSLQWNPVLIYEWVKNNVETEWYWGVMKGAEETMRQKSGNDADHPAGPFRFCRLVSSHQRPDRSADVPEVLGHEPQ